MFQVLYDILFLINFEQMVAVSFTFSNTKGVVSCGMGGGSIVSSWLQDPIIVVCLTVSPTTEAVLKTAVPYKLTKNQI